ncbi:MAG: enoyl-CoA hydratase/isomerase family protein [Gammaproteobacteria bacterium]|nr:enoyl-CoA hydratase/isomerase family protein [Gammaproteobacteria bacterium]
MTLPNTRHLLLSQDAGVLNVTFNRPQARNAMSLAMLAEIEAVFDAIVGRRDVRAVTLRGAGGHFCAGGDMKEMLASGQQAPASGQTDPVVVYSRAFGTMLRRVEAAPQVVIAVCEGAVLGGGFGLTCVSDVALAQVDARFGLPETTRGLPPAQIAPFVVRRIGLTQARRLCLTGAQFDGHRAAALGLVHETFTNQAELNDKLGTLVDQIRRCAPDANAMTKQIILSTARMDMDQVLDLAAHKFAAAVRGAEAPEGIQAFLQKRKPSWAA